MEQFWLEIWLSYFDEEKLLATLWNDPIDAERF